MTPTNLCGTCGKPKKPLTTMVAPPTAVSTPTQAADILDTLRQQQSAPPVPDMRAALARARKEK
jgi:hypothetical protein